MRGRAYNKCLSSRDGGIEAHSHWVGSLATPICIMTVLSSPTCLRLHPIFP